MTQPTTSPTPPPPRGRHENEGTDALSPAARSFTEGVLGVDLAERIDRALRATGYGALRDVTVSVHAGVVTLGGWLPSYHLEQVALATACAVAKAHRVRNDLLVVCPG